MKRTACRVRAPARSSRKQCCPIARIPPSLSKKQGVPDNSDTPFARSDEAGVYWQYMRLSELAKTATMMSKTATMTLPPRKLKMVPAIAQPMTSPSLGGLAACITPRMPAISPPTQQMSSQTDRPPPSNIMMALTKNASSGSISLKYIEEPPYS